MRLPIFLITLLTTLAACGGGGGGGAISSPPPPPGGPPVTAIPAIQGNGAASPLVGQEVTVTGVVTGDFQSGDGDALHDLGGFFIQGIPDADLQSSDGVFVFDGNAPAIDVSAGDNVEVTGTVNEYFGETRLTAASVGVVGTGAIMPAPVNFPVAGAATNSDGELIADLERFEGMLLRLPQTMTVASLRELERYGAVLLAAGGRPVQFTNANAPDAVAYSQYLADIAAQRIVLDDGRNAMNATPVRYLDAGPGATYSIRVGDEITEVTGNLRYSRGIGGSGTETWRLMPTVAPQFAVGNPRPGAPAIGGTLRVASFNALNFFTTIDSGQSICGPSGNSNCRGADSSAEFNRQLAKFVSALVMIDADVVGLVELENNTTASLQAIVDAINAATGAGRYEFVDTGTIGAGVIKGGFIYKPATVSPQGAFAILDSNVDARFDDNRNRPALAQTFTQTSDGAALTLVLNHLKSKGSDCDSSGDPDTGDGQGNCNRTRTNAALAIADWIALDPTASGDPDFLIMGDLNAYVAEDPLTALRAAGFTNLVEASAGGNAYSFVFDGQAGALDHALASASLVPQVVETLEWHINADEPALLDYNLDSGRDPALFDATTPYRSSDHDPVIVGLDLAR
jgi:predicted extracellular nuclease